MKHFCVILSVTRSCYVALSGLKLAMWESYSQSLRDFDSLLFVDEAPCVISCQLMGKELSIL